MDLTYEDIIEPDLPIVDAHQHLWLVSETRLAHLREMGGMLIDFERILSKTRHYLVDALAADVNGGHNIIANVFIECESMYRSAGPEEFKSTGEIEFACGVAAMFASGAYGPTKACAGIVGHVDLAGDHVAEVLAAHVAAAGGRYRGVRCMTMHDNDPSVMGMPTKPGTLSQPRFREGFKILESMGLSFDTLVLAPQLDEVIALARAFGDTTIITDHMGAPVFTGRHAIDPGQTFSQWRDAIRALAECPNVVMKLGGLGTPLMGKRWFLSEPPATSQQLAAEWQPYFDVCVVAFGVDRCMFEGNYPSEAGMGSYVTIWNALKRLASGMSATEKTRLFSQTAIETYRLELGS